YVATGVQGSLLRPLGFILDSLQLNRRSKPSSNDEWFYFPNPNPQTAGYYDPQIMNMGDIAQFFSRKLDWQVTAPTSEGKYTLTFEAAPTNGGGGSVNNSVIVDGTAPTTGNAESLHWGTDLTPDVTIKVKDTLAGLNVGEAFYRYSKDGGTTWSS